MILAIFLPNQRAGKTNAGSRTRLSRVSCQDMLSIAASTNTMVSELLTTFCSVDGERLLRAEHVAVEPLHQRAGLGAAEERERHALHVVEDRGAQVEDQALAHLRRHPAVGDGQAGAERSRAPATTAAMREDDLRCCRP